MDVNSDSDFESPKPKRKIPLKEHNESNKKEFKEQKEKQAEKHWHPSYNKTSKNKITMEYLRNIVLVDKKKTLEWLMEKKVIAACHVCKVCKGQMRLVPFSGVKACNDGYRWRCTAKIDGKKHDTSVTIRAKSWFSGSNMTLQEIVLLTYYWCHNLPQEYIIHELGLSSATIVDWFNFAREVCEELIIRNSVKIGGPGVEVEIDETKIGKRKYNRGRHVDGQWVFGGRETNDRSKIFMVPVADRTKETLVGLIEKWIEKGSIIVSDCWASYRCLGEIGYVHKTVNHSETFKDPETGACTNHIEQEWLHAKKSLPKYGCRHEHISSYLSAHMWRLCVKEKGGDVFLEFLDAVRTVYVPDTWNSV